MTDLGKKLGKGSQGLKTEKRGGGVNVVQGCFAQGP